MEQSMKKWQCFFCGFVYDEAEGIPLEGIAPGTAWKDIPDGWVCPGCGATKSDFAMMEA
jgi:rubredoxin